MEKLLSTKRLIVRGSALLAFLSIIAGYSHLYAGTDFYYSPHARVRTLCLSSNSKDERNGNNAPTPNNHFCFSHCHFNYQEALIGTLSLFNPGRGNRFKPFEEKSVPFPVTTSIFRPPRTHS